MKKIILVVVIACSTTLLQARIVFPDSWHQLKNQAYEAFQEKDYIQAIKITEKALEVARVKYGEESLEYADSLGSLSSLYRKYGDLLKDKTKKIRKKHGQTGMPVGIETEMFFDEVINRMQQLSIPTGEAQQEEKQR